MATPSWSPSRPDAGARPGAVRNYRSEPRAFVIAAAASGDARNLISARPRPAPSLRTHAPANATRDCSSAGIGPTRSMPGTWISSLTCWKPISASPRATTAATGSPEGGPRTLRLFDRDLVGNTQLREQHRREIGAAAAVGVRDGLGGEQRLLEGVDGARCPASRRRRAPPCRPASARARPWCRRGRGPSCRARRSPCRP